MKKETNSKNKGITLIALVITIIVLLILAAISIATLTGENGILTKSETAKEETEREDIIEKARVDILAQQAENLGSLTEKELTTILNKYGTLSEEENIFDRTLTDKENEHKIKVSDIWNGTLAVDNVKEKNPITFTVMGVNFSANEGDTWEDFFKLDLAESKRDQGEWGIGKWKVNGTWGVVLFGYSGSGTYGYEVHQLTLNGTEIMPNFEIQKDAVYEYEEKLYEYTGTTDITGLLLGRYS